MEDLQAFISELRLIINQQSETIKELKETLESQSQRIVELEDQVRILKKRKNSNNSSLPPSMDLNRPTAKPNQSLRNSSDKKSGGQSGHKGETLKMSLLPDQVIPLKVESCSHCSQSLLGADYQKLASRQVVDIPPVKPIYTQYDQYSVCCPYCAGMNKASFPDSVNAPIQYGPGVMASIAYLSSRQYLSMARIAELFTNFYGLNISEGTVANLLSSFAKKAYPLYTGILEKLRSSDSYVGSDETGCRIEGQLKWLWALQNDDYTFLYPSENRGFETIKNLLESEKEPNYILVTDCLALYFKLGGRDHQICLAHIRRDLQYARELEPKNKWLTKLDELLLSALKLKDRLLETYPDPEQWSQSMDRYWIKARKDLEKQLNKWIAKPVKNLGETALRLKKRLNRHIESLTRFLHHHFLPPDNNGSERAIRNVKVKTKVSGQFRTMQGAHIFAIYRSIIDTCIKQKKDPFQFLVQLAGT